MSTKDMYATRVDQETLSRLNTLALTTGRTKYRLVGMLLNQAAAGPDARAHPEGEPEHTIRSLLSPAQVDRLHALAAQTNLPMRALITALIRQARLPDGPDVRLPAVFTVARLAPTICPRRANHKRKIGLGGRHRTERRRRDTAASENAAGASQKEEDSMSRSSKLSLSNLVNHTFGHEGARRLSELADRTGRTRHEVLRLLILQAHVTEPDEVLEDGPTLIRITRGPLGPHGHLRATRP